MGSSVFIDQTVTSLAEHVTKVSLSTQHDEVTFWALISCFKTYLDFKSLTLNPIAEHSITFSSDGQIAIMSAAYFFFRFH